MGMPFFKARPVIEKHDVTWFSSNYTLYGDVSRRMFDTIGRFVPALEHYSIDEAFVHFDSGGRQEEDARRQKSKNVSHTTPLTVAAELGTVGLLVYVAFLAALGRAVFAAWERHQAVGLPLAGCLTALVVQSLSYGGFFEDPFVWGIAGVAAAVLTFMPARSGGRA